MSTRVILSAALLAIAGSAAQADVAVSPIAAANRSLNGPSVSERGVLPPATLYSATVQTGFRYTPTFGNPTGTPPSPALVPDIAYDDIPISNPGLAPIARISEITIGIRRLANAPATNVELSWASLNSGAPTLGAALITPRNTLTSFSLPANGATSVTQLLTFTPLVPFDVPLSNDFFAPQPSGALGAFAVGISMSNPDGNNGIRLTTPDVGFLNANQLFWLEDTEIPAVGAVSFGVPSATVPPSTFYVVVKGNLVPAPGSAAMLGLAGVAAIRRRRR